MVVTKGNDDITVNVRGGEETFEQVGKYKYFGGLAMQDGRCVKDISTQE